MVRSLTSRARASCSSPVQKIVPVEVNLHFHAVLSGRVDAVASDGIGVDCERSAGVNSFRGRLPRNNPFSTIKRDKIKQFDT